MKNNSRKNQPRDKKGRFVSIAAIYSSKHNTLDFERVYVAKMRMWEEEGLCKADDVITPFEYRPETFNVPSSYMYGPGEMEKAYSDEDRNYALVMVDLSLGEKSSYVARLIPLNIDVEPMYVKNELWHNESLALVHLDDLNRPLDLSIPFDSIVSDEIKFQGVVAKHKLKDLVIDTTYKLVFNKIIKTHYVNKNTLYDDSPIHVCRYFKDSIDALDYKDVSAIIFTKTTFDKDGDRMISIKPTPRFVLVELDDKFIAYSLDDDSFEEIKSLDDLTSLVPNLMIPEEMLKELTKIEFINRKEKTPVKSDDEPTVKTNDSNCLDTGVRINLILNVLTDIPVGSRTAPTVQHVSDREVVFLKVYRLGEFRAPRFQTMAKVQSEINNPIEFQLAAGPNDLWILLAEKIDKIYLYSVHRGEIVDWCLATSFEFLKLLNKFSSSFITEEAKGELLELLDNIRRNYYSKGIVSADKNEGLEGLLKRI